jgi:hypothetical protein
VVFTGDTNATVYYLPGTTRLGHDVWWSSDRAVDASESSHPPDVSGHPDG